MIHCDECVHLICQETLFSDASEIDDASKTKLRKSHSPYNLTLTVRDQAASRIGADAIRCHCLAGVPIVFQMPSDGNRDDWGYRPHRRCTHFTPKEAKP